MKKAVTIHEIRYDGHFVFEDGRGEDVADWVEHAATFPELFVALYGKDLPTDEPDSAKASAFAEAAVDRSSGGHG
jgi:hypothetical protein